MRKPLYAATVAVAAVLAGGVAAVPAQADTPKEMKVCWTSPAGTNYGIKVVLDGPTSRSKWLASGECKSWSVRPGAYKVIWANLDDLYERARPFWNSGEEYDAYRAAVGSICGPPPADSFFVASLDPKALVKRFKNTYVTRELNNSGVVQTNVQRNRLTKINFRMHCDYNTLGI